MGQFLNIFARWGFFPKNPALSHATIHGPLTLCKVSEKKNRRANPKKTDGRRKRRRKDGIRTDGQKNLFYRTLPAKAGDPTTSLQQLTGGNTPDLVLKRMLRYFLYSYKRENFKPEIKPMIENLRNELYQLENKQAKGAKLLGNIRSWRAKNAPKLSSKYLKDSIR